MSQFLLPAIDDLPLSNHDKLKFKKANCFNFDSSKYGRINFWTTREDMLLEKEVKNYENFDDVDWNQIALKLSKALFQSGVKVKSLDAYQKSPDECMQRYKFKNPEIRNTPFEHWEDMIIVNERSKIGNQWTLIAKKLPGRTPSGVKNRWYTVLRHQRWTHPFLYPQSYNEFINA